MHVKSHATTFPCFQDHNVTPSGRLPSKESYGAFKQVNARSAVDKHALSILNHVTVHNGER